MSRSHGWYRSSFEWVMCVSEEDLNLFLLGYEPIPWEDFVLNPRRLRGSDFLMRWAQGRWSEERIKDAVDNSGEFFALLYGPSSVAPKDPKEFEQYFESLDKANPEAIKRPDLLIFSKEDRGFVKNFTEEIGGEKNIPFRPEDKLQPILQKAVAAIECENSLWIAQKMPDYGQPLRPMRRLGNRLGLPKNAVVPTIIVKDEDLDRLQNWQQENNIPIHIWHVFYDRAYGISLDKLVRLIDEGLVEKSSQVFQAPSGATTTKDLYKVIYHYAYVVGTATEEPKITADKLVDTNGHILPYVRFEKGAMKLSGEALDVLRSLRGSKK